LRILTPPIARRHAVSPRFLADRLRFSGTTFGGVRFCISPPSLRFWGQPFVPAAQYGLKLIVNAMAQGVDHLAAAWRALAVFAGLLAGESMLWRFGSWLGYRAMLVDKAEAKLDLFDHLGGHSSRYFTDLLSGSLASRISSTGDSV
jgi:hypothetical protein